MFSGGTALSNDLPLPAVVNTPTAGSGEDTRTSTRTPSSGMPANGFQERPWHAQEDGEGGRGPGVVVVLAQDAAAAAGQGVFVELHLGPAVITSHPRIFAPAAGACQAPAIDELFGV
jgi:hypothetical protein